MRKSERKIIFDALRKLKGLRMNFLMIEKELDDLITKDILRKQKDEAEKPGPAHLREEVSPQEWKEPSSTGAEKGGQN